jgi:hypothetical protein
MSVLQDVVVISLDVHIWSGRKKLRPEDLTTSGTLPPKELVSLGSKKIFNPEALKPFAKLKREAEVLCLAKGVRFARAFAVPKSDLRDVLAGLRVLGERFARSREAFLATYEAEREKWKAQYPGYERLIETEFLSKGAVAARLSFGYQPFSINEVELETDESAVQDRGAGTLVLGLVGQLYQEVAAEAKEHVSRSLIGRVEVTQKFLRPLRAIREKLAGMAFLDATLEPIVKTIDDVLGAIPKEGKLAGLGLEALRGVLALLSDPHRMRAHAEAILRGETPSLGVKPGLDLDVRGLPFPPAAPAERVEIAPELAQATQPVAVFI